MLSFSLAELQRESKEEQLFEIYIVLYYLLFIPFALVLFLEENTALAYLCDRVCYIHVLQATGYSFPYQNAKHEVKFKFLTNFTQSWICLKTYLFIIIIYFSLVLNEQD